MNPLATLFGLGVGARNALYDHGFLKTRRLQWPVVSIGNIRAGGTGKTPFAIHLGKLLQQKGIAFDVLSRGYGRDNEKSIKLVDPKGSPAEFGDEPLLMSQKLGVPVIVSADRFAAGRFAERMFANMKPAHGGKWVHLLDDGFQHRRLHRDFDIVLISATDAADSLLPAGRLREPLAALHRADAIVLVDDARGVGMRLEAQHIWHAHREVDVSDLSARPVAFCGVANAERFFDDLRVAGIEVAGERAFPDHHHYSATDIRDLAALGEKNNADGFVTTEKDLINLRRVSPDLLQQLRPLKAVSMQLVLEDPEAALVAILQACAIPQ